MQQRGLVYAGKIAYAWKGDIPPNTHIALEEGTRAIASSAFNNDYTNYSSENLVGILIPNSVVYIGDNAFAMTGLTSVVLPNGLRSLGQSAFGECTSLVSVDIPDSVIFIHLSAFMGCTSLDEATRARILSINPNARFD
jgi:hypothetical protein